MDNISVIQKCIEYRSTEDILHSDILVSKLWQETAKSNNLWKKRTFDKFGHLLEKSMTHTNWFEYYKYLYYMFYSTCKVFKVRLGKDFKEISEISIKELLPTASTLQKGDLVEVLDLSGYRMAGVFVFTSTKTLKPLSDYPDKNGTIPSFFSVITEFPLGYWHKDSHFENAYWSNELVFLDCSFTFSSKKNFISFNTFFDEIVTVYIQYFIFQCKGINYCIFFESRFPHNNKLTEPSSGYYEYISYYSKPFRLILAENYKVYIGQILKGKY